MSAPNFLTVGQSVQCLRDGKVIAYPTEAVYGLGCDPADESAVGTILDLKSRPASAGLILIAHDFQSFLPFIQTIDQNLIDRAMATWPGPVTWLFPKAGGVPDWLAGKHATIALRLTAHPVCRALCSEFGGAIVSTSANPSGQEPARTSSQVENYFGERICGITAGELGAEQRPSEIRDLVGSRIVREG
jgi:L-threonylcarbamoyladenylate synthase